MSENSTWELPARIEPVEDISAFHRLWLGFMAARMGVGVVLLVLLGGLMLAGLTSVNGWQLALCGAYLLASVAVRMFARPALPGRTFDPQWVSVTNPVH